MSVLLSLRYIFCTLLLVAVSTHCKKQQQAPSFRKLLRKSILAPSWRFQNIDHKWQWREKYNDKGSQAISVFIQEFEKSYKLARNELVVMFGEESMIESRLRPLDSISQELDDDRNKTIKDIYDVITWRVTFPTVQQLVQAKYRFLNSTRFGVAIVKCFGVCPKAGKYSATGYRGITLIAELDGKPTEIQLMTPYMVMWADWAYGVLLDESLGFKEDVQKYARNLTDYYYQLDSTRDKRPACPSTLRKANMKLLSSKLTKQNKIYDSLGSPPSACQFWNDLAVNKNLNFGARHSVLETVDEHKKKRHGNKPSVIDIDKILKPENLKEGKEDKDSSKRTLQGPVYYYY